MRPSPRHILIYLTASRQGVSRGTPTPYFPGAHASERLPCARLLRILNYASSCTNCPMYGYVHGRPVKSLMVTTRQVRSSATNFVTALSRRAGSEIKLLILLARLLSSAFAQELSFRFFSAARFPFGLLARNPWPTPGLLIKQSAPRLLPRTTE